ncbi:MAG: hypothetical protein KGV59_01450 [Tenacibaculum sp.]|nr:hypothetical protein [Tenacibaculum sp.]
MLIQDTATLREHLSVNGSVEIENVKPYLKKAERSFLKPAIGLEQLDEFSGASPQTDTNEVFKEALDLTREVVANYGYFLYLPIGAVQITNSGIQVVDNEHTKTATDKQFKELQRSFLTSAHEALDELLLYMEQHSQHFPKWVNSACYSVYNELLVNNSETFNKYYYIFNSRQTFMALKPKMRMVEDRFIRPVVGDEKLKSLKVQSSKLNENDRKLKEYLQQSIVAFTIMDVLDSGMFVLDAQGMKMRFDVLPYEKAIAKEFKTNSKFKENKKIEGEEYLKMAVGLLKQNEPNTKSQEDKKDYIQITKTNGIIGI